MKRLPAAALCVLLSACAGVRPVESRDSGAIPREERFEAAHYRIADPAAVEPQMWHCMEGVASCVRIASMRLPLGEEWSRKFHDTEELFSNHIDGPGFYVRRPRSVENWMGPSSGVDPGMLDLGQLR